MTREEQIRLARQLLESGVLSEESANAIKADFPELAESEDERIRKDITRVIKEWWQHGSCAPGFSTEDEMLTYLEKQKEQNGSLRVIKDASEWEKIKEQNPAEWSEEDEKILVELLDHCNTENATWYNWLISLRPPFKDKEMKLKILKYLSTRCSSLEFEEVEDYLNNLCPQPHWKPSEEQMEALDEAQAKLNSTEWNQPLCSLIDDLKKLM